MPHGWGFERILGMLLLGLAGWWAVRTGYDHARLQMVSEELEAARAQRENMIAIVAHELRGALSSVSGYSKLLLRDSTQNERRPALLAIARGSDRLDMLTQDLLDAASLEMGGFTLNRASCDIVSLTREHAELLSTLTGREILLTRPHEALFGNWDALRLSQVIRNLLSNSIKYGPEDRPVCVDVGVQCGAVAVAVSNEAPGVTEEDVARLFLPYSRLKVHQQGEGSGLGLYVTRALVERHGGRIEAHLGDGKLAVRFTLPLDAASLPETAGES